MMYIFLMILFVSLSFTKVFKRVFPPVNRPKIARVSVYFSVI